ncbi:mandelate racemase/muconate lactonizing enzyme family protein [Acidobacteria bacterium AH-259-O06]|nr:mandelate racemase/muconate lactonizing enzyme family protein [Acidobacteria bacterium AH-259-O06]
MQKRSFTRRDFLAVAAGAAATLASVPQVVKALPSAATELGKVKITDIKTAQIQARYAFNLVKIETDSGLYGIGEAFARVGIIEHIHAIKERLIAQDPLLVETHWSRMMESSTTIGSQAGSLTSAIAGIESAMWDLAGKILNVPIYVLLGAKYRDKVMVYFDTGAPRTADPSPWVDEAMRVKSLGYKSMKFDLDWEGRGAGLAGRPYKYRRDMWNRSITSLEMHQWLHILEAIRKAVGDDIDLSVDLHWEYNTRDALRFAQMAEPIHLLFLEDPTPPGNPDAMARITAATKTPIATGENLYTRDQFRPYIEKQACDIIQPDTQKTGGLLETKRIGDLADLYYLPMCIHTYGSPVGALGSGHVATASRSFLQLESDNIDIPWWTHVVQWEGPLYQDGYLTLPDAPGLGVELNEEVCRAHLVPGTTFFE